MNDVAIENFISYCDDMMIAEESVRAINKKYKAFITNLESLESQIKSTDSIQKVIPLYQKLKVEISKLKSEIEKERELGLEDAGGFIKNTIAPVLLGALTVAGTAMNVKNGKKKDAVEVGVLGSAFTAFSVALAKDNMKEFKATKSNVLKLLDEYAKACDGMIQILQVSIKHGAKTMDDVKNLLKKDVSMKSPNFRKDLTDNKSSLLYDVRSNDDTSVKALAIGKAYPAPDMSKSMDALVDFMANDVIKYLKKYVNTPSFKSTYKQFLHMIHITREDYSDVFSISITTYQDGIDWDLVEKWEKENPGKDWKDSPVAKNNWYQDLLDAGVNYINDKFQMWNDGVWHGVGIGDGDAGCIYVD